MKTIRKYLALFLILAIALGSLAGCGSEENREFNTQEDFAHAKVGVMAGSSFNLLANEYFPDGKIYHMNMADLILNLKQAKIDGILMDTAFFTPVKWENEELSYIKMDMPATEYAVALPKTAEAEALKSQIDEFIGKHREDGMLEQLEKKWFTASEPGGSPDMSLLSGENGTLRVAATADCKPFDYIRGEDYCGYDAEFIYEFAKEYGYALEVDIITFDALLPSLAAGRYDLALSGITITEERSETTLFSDAYYRSPIVMAVLAEGEVERTLADYAHGKIGIMTGSSHDATVKELFPEAERVYFNTVAEEILAVEQGKIDCYIEDEPFLVAAEWEGANVKRMAEPVKQVLNGFVFPKGEESRALREQLNEFISASIADGTVDALKEKWLSNAEPTEHPDIASLSGENGTIRLAVNVEGKPLLYLKDDFYTGFEIEFLTLFGQQYGYKYEIEAIPFGSIVAGIAAGKYDMAASMNITPEREESVDFSDPYTPFDVLMVVKNADAQKEGRSLAEFENATLGIFSGSSFDALAKERFPNARRQYYTVVPDMILAVEQGKVDGYITETTYVTAAIWEGARIKAVEEILDRTSAGYIFKKDSSTDALREQLNAFIRAAYEDGTIAGLQEKWFGKEEPTDTPDYDSLTGENGTLRLGVAPDLKPISYIKDGAASGYEMELLYLFAKEYGYKLDMSYVTFDAILPGVTTGKYDIGTGAITITDERAQSVNFSDSHLTVDVVMVVKAEDEGGAKTGFWDGVKEDFEKTFIREDRWKMIVQGVGVTMLISISAAVAGSLLGFGLYMLSRTELKPLRLAAKAVAKVYSRIVAGTPVVVILMILFYVVFGKVRDMSGIVVAILGFTLTFGAFVYDHMTVSVGSVDPGQTEAAYAIGYPRNKAFFRIVFPQAMSIFLPSYCGQAVELIKATAVVGYVAVNDLTKVGDIIRSNTYEAFFPLIATAVIYFLLTWLLAAALKLLKRRFEPKRRSREEILKGVKTV